MTMLEDPPLEIPHTAAPSAAPSPAAPIEIPHGAAPTAHAAPSPDLDKALVSAARVYLYQTDPNTNKNTSQDPVTSPWRDITPPQSRVADKNLQGKMNSILTAGSNARFLRDTGADPNADDEKAITQTIATMTPQEKAALYVPLHDAVHEYHTARVNREIENGTALDSEYEPAREEVLNTVRGSVNDNGAAAALGRSAYESFKQSALAGPVVVGKAVVGDAIRGHARTEEEMLREDMYRRAEAEARNSQHPNASAIGSMMGAVLRPESLATIPAMPALGVIPGGAAFGAENALGQAGSGEKPDVIGNLVVAPIAGAVAHGASSLAGRATSELSPVLQTAINKATGVGVAGATNLGVSEAVSRIEGRTPTNQERLSAFLAGAAPALVTEAGRIPESYRQAKAVQELQQAHGFSAKEATQFIADVHSANEADQQRAIDVMNQKLADQDARDTFAQRNADAAKLKEQDRHDQGAAIRTFRPEDQARAAVGASQAPGAAPEAGKTIESQMTPQAQLREQEQMRDARENDLQRMTAAAQSPIEIPHAQETQNVSQQRATEALPSNPEPAQVHPGVREEDAQAPSRAVAPPQEQSREVARPPAFQGEGQVENAPLEIPHNSVQTEPVPGIVKATGETNAPPPTSPDVRSLPPSEGGRLGQRPTPASSLGQDALGSGSRARRPGIVEALQRAAKRFRGVTIEDNGTDLHVVMPSGKRIKHVLMDRIAPRSEQEIENYLDSAKAENDGAKWFEHNGNDYHIPSDAAEWNKLSEEHKNAILDTFRATGRYDHANSEIHTTDRVTKDHSIAEEEIFHAHAAELRATDRDTYNRMINRYDNEDAAFRGFIGSKKSRAEYFERIRKGTTHVIPDKPLSPRQQAENILLQAAQADGHLMSDSEFEQFQNDQAGLHPDVLKDYTPKEQAKLRPFVNEGAWSNMVDEMGTKRAESAAERIINEVLMTKPEKIQKAAETYHDENAHPDLQKAAELILKEPVARTPEEPNETEPTAEEAAKVGEDEVAPFATRRDEEDKPINTDLLGNRVGASVVGGGNGRKTGSLFGETREGTIAQPKELDAETKAIQAKLDKSQMGETGRLFAVRKRGDDELPEVPPAFKNHRPAVFESPFDAALYQIHGGGKYGLEAREYLDNIGIHDRKVQEALREQLQQHAHKFNKGWGAIGDWNGNVKSDTTIPDSGLYDAYRRTVTPQERAPDWRPESTIPEDYFAVRKRGTDEPSNVQPKPETPEDKDTRPAATLFGQYDQSPTGIRNRETDKMRENLGLSAAAPVMRRAYADEVMNDARAEYDANPNAGHDLSAQLRAKPRPVTDTEDAILTMHQVELQTQHAKAAKELVDAKAKGDDATASAKRIEEAALSDKLLEHYNLTREVGTANARGLAARRIMMNEDYSLAAMETRARAARGGEPLTPKEKEIITEQAAKIASLQKQIEENAKKADARVRKARASAAADKIIAEGQADNPGKSRSAAKRESILAGIRQLVASSKQGLGAKFAVRSEGEPSPESAHDFEEAGTDYSTIPGLGKALEALAKTHVEEGIRDRENLLDLVHDETKDALPGMSRSDKMDAISGYGKYKQLSKDEIAVAMRDLKGQMQQVGKLEDMQAGQPPSKTGVERRTPSDEERRLIQQVNETKKRLNIQTTDPETQLKSALQSRKTAITNQIKDLEYQIAKGEKTVKSKTPGPSDAELETLKAKRDQLHEEFYKIFGKPGITEEQRMAAAVKSAQRAADDAEARVKSGELITPGKPKMSSPELDAARARRDAANAELKNLRNSTQWYQDMQAQKSQTAKVEAMQAKIDANAQRIAAGDVAAKKTPGAPDSPELAALRKQNATLNGTIAKMREEAKVPDRTYSDKREEELQKRIDALSAKIAAGDTSVKSPRQGPEPAGIYARKEQLAALNKQMAEMRANPKSGEEVKLKQLAKQIETLRERVLAGDISPMNRSRQGPDTEAVAQAKAQRDALSKELADLRKNATPKKTPEEIALAAFKTRTLNRMAELAEKMARGDYGASEPRKPLTLDPEATKLQATLNRFKQAYDDGNTKARYANRSFSEKAQDYFTAWRRMAILSGESVLAKLSAAAAARVGIAPIEEGVGGVLSKVPGLSKIASKAAREGGFNTKAEVAALTSVVTKGMPEAWKKLTTGHSDMDALYGKMRPASPTPAWMEFFGRLHGALKEPVRQSEWARSFEKRMQWNARNGVDVSDPIQQMRIGKEAYEDSNRSIFMQDNWLANKIANFIRAPKDPTVGQKIFETVGKTLLPITKVPTNIVAEAGSYAFGTVTGSFKAGIAFGKGIEQLKPEQADSIMRSLKKGSLGAAAMALGYFAAGSIGGFYQQGEKRKDGEPPAGGAKLFGQRIPPLLLHHPLFEAMNIGATMRRVADSWHKGEKRGAVEGAAASAFGLLEEVPFVRETADIQKLADSNTRNKALADQAKSIVIPAGVQQPINWMHPKPPAETTQSDLDSAKEKAKYRNEGAYQFSKMSPAEAVEHLEKNPASRTQTLRDGYVQTYASEALRKVNSSPTLRGADGNLTTEGKDLLKRLNALSK